MTIHDIRAALAADTYVCFIALNDSLLQLTSQAYSQGGQYYVPASVFAEFRVYADYQATLSTARVYNASKELFFNISTGETKTFVSGDDIEYPAAIAVDEVSGDVYVTSYKIDPDTGYADYFNNGYVNQYKADGTFVRQFATGVGPTALVFNYNIINE